MQIFDLGRRSLRPSVTIDQNTGGQPAYCLEFSPQQLLAVGNADGTVNIWQLSAELTEQGSRETALLEQLANEVAEWDLEYIINHENNFSDLFNKSTI